VVAKKQRGIEAFGCKSIKIEMKFWQSIMTICILRAIVEHPITVNMSSRWASTEHQGFLALPFLQSNSYMVTSFQTASIGRRCRWKGRWHARYPVLELSVNRAWKIFGSASWIINWLCNDVIPSLQYWPPLWATMVVTILLLPSKDDHQQSINNFWSCILDNQKAT